MALYVLSVRYDGMAFHGSQIQGSTPTVQLRLNQALAILARHPITTLAASRTDAGVHAFGNYFQVELESPPLPDFLYSLNALLPRSISVDALFVPASPKFHARFDALSRLYTYRIYSRKDPFQQHRAYYYPFTLDIRKLKETAAMILEGEDFARFSKRNSQTRTSRCQIMKSCWRTEEAGLVYQVRANRFLRGMVRALVGTQLQVARGKYSLGDFQRLIGAQDSLEADFSPPGHGLYLERIEYPPGMLIPWAPDL